MFKKHLLAPTHCLVGVAKLTMLPTKLSELPFVAGWQESEGLSLEQTTQVQVPALHLSAGGNILCLYLLICKVGAFMVFMSWVVEKIK